MKLITEYLNYRDFLKDWIEERKREGLPGSNRWFAQRMGINSSSWLTAILTGARNLNEKHLEQLIAVLKLSPYEASLFRTLVSFNQAHNELDKKNHFEKLKKIKARHSVQTVSGQFYDYYQNWYNSAVRALIGMVHFKDDYKGLAALLNPEVSVKKVEESVALLEKIGFIEKDEEGYYRLTHIGITTGEYERSVAIQNFQSETILLAKGALHRFEKGEKDISTLTLGIAKSSIPKVQSILAEARKQIAEIADADEYANITYQLNMQLFPLSHRISANEKEL